MSTVYTDLAGNKYLGDCQWGNHDIFNPSTNYLITENLYSAYSLAYVDDVYSLMSASGWGSLSKSATWSSTDDVTLVAGTPPYSGARQVRFRSNFNGRSPSLEYVGLFNLAGTSASYNQGSFRGIGFSTPTSFCVLGWSANTTHYPALFQYVGKLENINTNFNYYSSSTDRNVVTLVLDGFGGGNQGLHYVTSVKNLLQTGRAIYSISCSDGQTPTSQWATDMWVYDNNSTLGFPVIGRVPNILLGTGSYTAFKPVKIQGSVFPDGGSPWYLPFGFTFAGKTLLMRCYSSMT